MNTTQMFQIKGGTTLIEPLLFSRKITYDLITHFSYLTLKIKCNNLYTTVIIMPKKLFGIKSHYDRIKETRHVRKSNVSIYQPSAKVLTWKIK